MRGLLFLVVLCSLAAAAGCASLPWFDSGDGAQPQAALAPATIDVYRLGCSDVVEVNVWKEPDLTRAVVVRSDGKVSLPLLGEVPAEGKTTSDFGAELAKAYQSFLENPTVTVTVLQANSSKFYVMGQVTRPGEYALVRGITVVQGVSTAGGFTEWANSRKLVLLRRAGGKEQRVRVNYREIVSGQRPQDNYVLLPGDTIVVP
jgi:polysaccharide export outer membrane protein